MIEVNQEDIRQSEYGATPDSLLVFNPGPWGVIETMVDDDLKTHNFLGMPHPSVLYREHAAMMGAIARYGGTLLELADLMPGDADFIAEARSNPNLFFTRDSTITAPFLGGLVIRAQMGLEARRKEPEVVTAALESAGWRIHTLELDENETVEGGDVIPVTFDGVRTLLVGISERTTFGAALALARELDDVDQVIAIHHPNEVLHLDTGLSLYPGVAVIADGMIKKAVCINKGRLPEEIDFLKFLKEQGYRKIPVSSHAAVVDEVCNVVSLGDNRYLGFEEMGPLLIELIEDLSGVELHTTPGGEIALATGGVHCSTRPLFGLKN